jgi:CRISPR-associated protein Csd1
VILKALHDLHGRLAADATYQLPPEGYSLQKVIFKVVLHPDGRLFDIQDARQDRDGRLVPRLTCVPGNNKSTGSGLNPGFMWDNSQYMLGFKAGDEKIERTRACFESFRDRHLQLRPEIVSPVFQAVCRFLETWSPDQAPTFGVLAESTTGFGVFQLIGEERYSHEDMAIVDWWSSQLAVPVDSVVGQCLVTGRDGPLARIHPSIRGIQSTGSAIVSFNDDSYTSYGKQQSLNAPVGVDAAVRYTSALNALLDGPRRRDHRVAIGDDILVFWTETPTVVEDIFAKFAIYGTTVRTDNPQDRTVLGKLDIFLRALRQGRSAYAALAADPNRTKFFILGLAPNRARLAVRYFQVDTVSGFVDHLRRHFADIDIQRRYSEHSRQPDPEFPSIRQLLDQTCPIVSGKPDRKNIPQILAGPLMRAILAGTPYPQALYAAVLRRLHAERDVSYLRACIIKGYLNRNRGKEVAMSLDIQRRDPAYRIGRLFATLEKTQIDGLPGLNTTIRDRFYSSASATPRAVFPRLMRTYQHHLAKIEGGMKVNREKLMQEILGGLESFPAQLDLDGQGLFAIGYYHQMRAFFTTKNTANGGDQQAGKEES